MKHKILWIGYGNFAQKIGRIVIDWSEKVEISFFYPDKVEAIKHFGSEASWDLSEALADPDTDIVFITTPNDSHAFYLEHCLRAKKHVFVEKPIAGYYHEALPLKALLQKDKVFMVGHNKRREAPIRKAKELISDGVIGEVVSIYANDSKGIAYQMDQSNWRFQKTRHREGPLITVGIHLIEAIHYLAGRVDSVSSVLKNISRLSAVPDSNATMLCLEKDATAFIEANYNMPSVDVFNIYGTDGIINILGDQMWLRNGRDINKVSSPELEIDLNPIDTIAEEINEFFDVIEGKKKNVETGYQEALNALAVIEACWQSSQQKRIVAMSEFKKYCI
ncbi:MAG: Gfo/Idh/MocA family oxidoreductase [Candidatus Yanofskybacteria bacterium]|nr:Gfo/Idh/MocA family oxidoreductase [Candidatus Yanofskybacteria bacterium]